MMILEPVLWAGVGLIIGSFTNVLILRQNTERSLGGRSACPRCGTILQWFELVPVLSWIALRGRCRTCATRISFQYPLVEIGVALGFCAVGLAPIPLVMRIFGCAIVMLLIAIAVYDIRHTIMPDVWVFGFAGLALTSTLYGLLSVPFESNWQSFFVLFASGPLVALPLFLLWYVSRGMWMGFGDVKFALGMGWLLGIGYGYMALLYAFVIGAIVGVCVLLPFERVMNLWRSLAARLTPTPPSPKWVQGFTMKSEVPFGPFLIVGTCIIWFSVLYSFEPTLTILEGLVWSSSWL